MTTTKSFKQNVVLTIGFIVSFLLLLPLTVEAGTGTIKGYIWDDDDWDRFNNQSTDSDGIWQSHEDKLGGVLVTITDGTGWPQQVATHMNLPWSAEVDTDGDVLVTVEPDPSNVPDWYIPTTPMYYWVTVEENATTWAPAFGFGPQI